MSIRELKQVVLENQFVIQLRLKGEFDDLALSECCLALEQLAVALADEPRLDRDLALELCSLPDLVRFAHESALKFESRRGQISEFTRELGAAWVELESLCLKCLGQVRSKGWRPLRGSPGGRAMDYDQLKSVVLESQFAKRLSEDSVFEAEAFSELCDAVEQIAQWLISEPRVDKDLILQICLAKRALHEARDALPEKESELGDKYYEAWLELDRLVLERLLADRNIWDALKASLPQGANVVGRVLEHRVFGAFVEIEGVTFNGLLLVGQMGIRPEERASEIYPVGCRVSVTVAGFQDINRQVHLTNPSVLLDEA